MNARALALALLPLLAAGDGPGRDPFLAALAGRSGPGAVEPPAFDAAAEARSWSPRPRREIVDGLAALLLRGEDPGSPGSPGEPREAPPPPFRIPADFDPGGVPVTDRLAGRVPADAAALLLPSLREAEEGVAALDRFLEEALPGLTGGRLGARREALRRGTDRLLLPTIWRANPEVRTGTRQVALVAADPDLRWGADVALVAEVDDLSLVLFHRRASLRWEEKGAGVLRVEGLDAVADDGSVRSFFGTGPGVAVWATTRDLRDRILAAGEGRANSLLRPDPRAWALARRTFPAEEGGALLVVPDGFLARAGSPAILARRGAALRCEAARLLLDARSLAPEGVSMIDTVRLSCPAGGELRPVAGSAGSSCSVHGTASDPVPLGDLPAAEAGPAAAGGPGPLLAALPVAARFRWSPRPRVLEALVPGDGPGGALPALLASLSRPRGLEGDLAGWRARERLGEEGFRRLTGLELPGPLLRALPPPGGTGDRPPLGFPPAPRGGGVLVLEHLRPAARWR